ncbi:MAG: polysaccharide biosynthesis protein [Nanoarchaeota archaeon]|nr:polysaccharide biosynthesis protein [Nanoarchaeota archaeon]MBU1321076.1 polysaccharide biosynthesis protein [Nanoarchaeota archaeon]MBU1597081.1 polysaccharide biosynthesis protein [Nanoarchaeota archaeon]MBU2440871.1 polysaccharide biosynthesis protein [Nanoarchaeota archaeon]
MLLNVFNKNNGNNKEDNIFKNKKILVTGGAGSIGFRLVKELMRYNPEVIRVLDTDESRLFYLENQLSNDKIFRFLLGDVRDKDRVIRAMEGIDIVFHLAALKHVKTCEYDPLEAVKTNIMGAQNIIEAALKNNVEKVIFTSSDKASSPNNTMGATKLLAEKLFNAANYTRGTARTVFASVRFGNVMGSRGSVIPLFKHQIAKGGPITLTNPNLTRYMMSLSDAVRLIIKCTHLTKKGGGSFILKMPVVKVGDLAKILIEHHAPKCNVDIDKVKTKVIGLKPGEASYEELMGDEERRIAIEKEDMFIIPSYLEMHRVGIESMGDDIIKDKKGYDSRYETPMSYEELKSLLKKERII